jgi:hypothetical protein
MLEYFKILCTGLGRYEAERKVRGQGGQPKRLFYAKQIQFTKDQNEFNLLFSKGL